MATKYLYSGAAGANDGSSWANAWTAISSATGLAAGDELLVHKTHSQTGLTTLYSFTNGTIANPVRIICVDKDNSDALATGASMAWSTNNTGVLGNLKCYGITFVGSGTGTIVIATGSAAVNGLSEFENCTFGLTSSGLIGIGTTSSSRDRMRFLNCAFDFNSATANTVKLTLSSNGAIVYEFIGCTITARGAGQTDLLSTISGSMAFLIMRGCTLSGTVTNLLQTSAGVGWNFIFDTCSMPTYTNLRNNAVGHYNGVMEIRNCVGGTISAAVVGPQLIDDYAGTISADLTRYRDGGASDGVSPYSLAINTNANALEPYGYLSSPPIVGRINAGAGQTVTVYIASGFTAQDDEVYGELLSPSESGSPTAVSVMRSSRVANRGTPANLATDGTSTWSGTGVGTLQKIVFTVSPTVAGQLVFRLFVAKASSAVYLSPELGVS